MGIDVLPTLCALAPGCSLATDRVTDGASLAELWRAPPPAPVLDPAGGGYEYSPRPRAAAPPALAERPLFHYRGGTLMAVRVGAHKLHLYDCGEGWSKAGGSGKAKVGAVRLVPPVLYHLGSDPSERVPVPTHSAEYADAKVRAERAIVLHEATLLQGVRHDGQLEGKDHAVQPCCGGKTPSLTTLSAEPQDEGRGGRGRRGARVRRRCGLRSVSAAGGCTLGADSV